MVIGIFGESCTGKSTLAKKLQKLLDAQVYSGKDYLRLAKNEAAAAALFREKLSSALSGSHVIYVITEKAHLSLLPDQALRILVTADLQIIQERFAQRMGGTLPPAVAAMLDRKHGCFDGEIHDFHVISGVTKFEEVSEWITGQIRKQRKPTEGQ